MDKADQLYIYSSFTTLSALWLKCRCYDNSQSLGL